MERFALSARAAEGSPRRPTPTMKQSLELWVWNYFEQGLAAILYRALSSVLSALQTRLETRLNRYGGFLEARS